MWYRRALAIMPLRQVLLSFFRITVELSHKPLRRPSQKLRKCRGASNAETVSNASSEMSKQGSRYKLRCDCPITYGGQIPHHHQPLSSNQERCPHEGAKHTQSWSVFNYCCILIDCLKDGEGSPCSRSAGLLHYTPHG